MTTKLEKELKREIDVDGKHYTVTLSPVGLKIAEKGHRKGHELTWKQVLTGEDLLPSELVPLAVPLLGDLESHRRERDGVVLAVDVNLALQFLLELGGH